MKLFLPLLALIACFAILFGYVGISYTELPERIASHFDLQGNPNGWMTRGQLSVFMLAIGLFMPFSLLGTMAAIGWGWLPAKYLNLPNREYWLAPERRPATALLLMESSLWYASANVLFITGMQWLVVDANRPGHGQHLSMTGLAVGVAGFLIATGAWCWFLSSRFRSCGRQSDTNA